MMDRFCCCVASCPHSHPNRRNRRNADIAYFRLPEKEGKAFLIGPGSILDAHSDHEVVRIEELQRAVGYYEDIVGRLLAERGEGEESG